MIKNAVVLLLLGFTLANANGTANLTDLINYALNHNRQIKKSDLQIKEAAFAIREIAGNGLPRVSDSVSYMRSESPKELYSASGAIQISQLIFSQQLFVGLQTSKKVKDLYSTVKEKNKDSIVAEIAIGYYQAGSLILQLQTVEKSIQNLNEILRIAELQYKSDMIKETNVSRLKVTITNLEVTKKTIENGIVTQLNYLKAIAGMPLDSIITIDTVALTSELFTIKTEIDFKADNVPLYQTLIKQSEINKQQIKLSMAQYFPTVAGFAVFKRSALNSTTDLENWTTTNAIGVVASMPLFTSGANYYKVKQAQLREEQIEQDISQLKDFLKVQYDNAVLEYQTSNDLLSVQKENRGLAQRVYNQTSSLYKEGMASLADLLNVNSDLLQADNSYNQQILKCKTSEIKMLKASGNLKKIINN